MSHIGIAKLHARKRHNLLCVLSNSEFREELGVI